MIADVHDEYRPTGFARTFPNWLTQEGIRGDEESPANLHTLITVFTRMLAGQGDNTICYFNERVDLKMGSHASQLAKAVCLFSPLQFSYWYDKVSPSLEKKMVYGELQTISGMNLNWSFSIIFQLSGTRRWFFLQRSVSME
jgi:alpha-glucosidase